MMWKRVIALLLALAMVLMCAFAYADPVKKERVYVIAGADGQVSTIIDNIQLSNPEGLDILNDRTRLTGIENVGGHESFTLQGETLTWQAGGNAIRYQGRGTEPVDAVPVVTCELDGAAPADLTDMTGALTIRVSYATHTDAPVLALTMLSVPAGMTDIAVENAMLLEESSGQIIVGYAVPGADEALSLPDSFAVTCKADHVSLKWMMTLVTNEPIALLCDEVSGRTANAETLVADLTALLTALRDGTELPTLDGEMKELADGLSAMLSGVDALADGASSLSSGATALDEGAAALETGLTALTENNEALNSGASMLFTAVLQTANQQLAASGLEAAGITIPQLTRENYAAVLDGAVASMTDLAAQGEAAAEAQVRAAVTAREAEIREGVTQAVRAQVLAGVLSAAGVNMTAEQYTAAAGAGLVSGTQMAQVDAAVDARMETEQIQTAIGEAVSAKIEELVAENLASEAVQAQLQQQLDAANTAVASLTALKTQLDQVNTFVTGLATYTDGVAQAQAGSVSLHSGTTQLAAGAASLSEGTAQLKTGMHDAVTGAADKALPILTGDVQRYLDAFQAMKDRTAAASGYDLLGEGMTAETVYIIRTDLR